jgi:hypothetical protein
MAELWYYARDDGPRSGPFSDQRLRDLADSDLIRRTDTVWREGTAQGVLAGKVRNLFAAIVVNAAPATLPFTPTDAVTAPPDGEDHTAVNQAPRQLPSPEVYLNTVAPVSAEMESEPEAAETVEEEAQTTKAAPSRPRPIPVRRGRAIAGRGAEIVGQDGITVKFRKRCIVCGHHDTCWHTMPIVNGVTRVSFYCPKCRKSRGAEIHGSFS